MDDFTKVLLGAIAGFVAALVGEHVKRVHASRAAAMMILRELAFHKVRLSLAIQFDARLDAEYGLIFPASVWSAQASALIAGAPVRQVEPILNWYASMAVLGFSIGRQLGPNGPELSGPSRNELSNALNDAYAAAEALSQRWKIRKGTKTVLPLFEHITDDQAGP
jgi:hypothetical protein